MQRLDLIELTAQLKYLVHGTLRRLLEALGEMRRAQSPESLGPRFGDYERVEEAKFHTAGAPETVELDSADLPASYGVTRLVLMPVDPYLVHAYWEVMPADLRRARRHLGQRRQRAQATLRFYDLTDIAVEGAKSRSRFDVDIDFQARNWYVHLWSPEKSYRVDLGFRTEDGSLVALARSNVVQTPPAGAAVEGDERYMRVEGEYQSVHLVPPAVEAPQGVRAAPPPARSTEPSGAGEQGAPAQRSSIQHGAPARQPQALQQPVKHEFPRPVSAAASLRRKLAELLALRTFGQQQPSTPVEALARHIAAPAAEETYFDLTAMSERKFNFGVSSERAHQDPSIHGLELPAGSSKPC